MRQFSIMIVCALCVAMLSNTSTTAHAAPKEKVSSGMEYVKLDPLLLPIIDDDGVQQVVSLVVAIEVEGLSNAEKIKILKPRLTDAYIQSMYGILNKHAALKGGVIQVKMLKDQLNMVTIKILGDDMHTDVLLQVLQQRPI